MIFLQKVPNYPTLRVALCDKAILVEGPTDEMVHFGLGPAQT